MYWASGRVRERRTLPFSEATKTAANAALDVAADKVSRLARDYPDYFPLYTHQGRWQLGVDESVMWGEYFFVETLARVGQAP
jgi:hypothetical protein